MSSPRNRADARAMECQRAGLLNPHIRLDKGEVRIGCRAPCGASLRVPLEGPIPECGVSCGCSAACRANAKKRMR